jgi:hypothetical protein
MKAAGILISCFFISCTSSSKLEQNDHFNFLKKITEAVVQPFLVLGAETFHQKEWLDTRKKLEHAPTIEEVIRNLPVRNPLIWIDRFLNHKRI